jgi:hypothetical protein
MTAVIIAASLLACSRAQAQTAADSAGIAGPRSTTARDEECRADDAGSIGLVKRILIADTTTGRAVVNGMGKTALVNSTARGGGKKTPEARRRKDVVIYDITGNAAVAKLTMSDWVDYLQLVRVDGRWVILNVLWELTPGGG